MFVLFGRFLGAEDWLGAFLLDPALRAAGIKENSPEAARAKEYGKDWLNPFASDADIDKDIGNIKDYVTGSGKTEEIRRIADDKTLSAAAKRTLLNEALDGIKACPVCSATFPIQYAFCPYDGKRLGYANDSSSLPGIHFAGGKVVPFVKDFALDAIYYGTWTSSFGVRYTSDLGEKVNVSFSKMKELSINTYQRATLEKKECLNNATFLIRMKDGKTYTSDVYPKDYFYAVEAVILDESNKQRTAQFPLIVGNALNITKIVFE